MLQYGEMEELIPLAMFVSRRAVCPGCGAPLTLEGTQANVRCDFCGVTSVVERRLRTNEPDVPPDRRRIVLDWTPSHLNPGSASERVVCWGCGAPMSFAGTQGIVRCGQCGSESKIERRLRPLDLDVPVEAGENPAVVRLIHRLKTSTDLAERVALAKEAFGGWQFIDRTLARHVGELMQIMESCDPRLEHAVGEAIGKLLCHGDVILRDAVVHAAHRFIRRPGGSRKLLWELGLGSGVCLKPLLDAADVAGRQGALEYACTALWAANTLLGRNHSELPVLGRIILYRTMYVSGPVLGWALRFIRGEGVPTYLYPNETLLEFIDDCAAERPKLVPEIARAVREETVDSESAYRARLELVKKLQSVEAKEVLLHKFPAPPRGVSMRLLNEAAETIVPLMEESRLRPSAAAALTRIMQTAVPSVLHALVREQGDKLPEDFRRAYLERVPDSPHLSRLPPRLWEPQREAPRDPEMQRAEEWYEEGIRRAVELYERDVQALEKYGQIIGERTPLMVASGRGDLEEVRRLLDQGADPNEANPYQWTPLMFASEQGRAAVIRELRARGADVAMRDKEGRTAAMIAAEAGQVEALREMRDIDLCLRQEAFRSAFRARRLEAMQLLLASGADPDMVDEDGATALLLAARQGWVEGVRALLAAGADPNHRDRRDRGFKDYAARPEVLQCLSSARPL